MPGKVEASGRGIQSLRVLQKTTGKQFARDAISVPGVRGRRERTVPAKELASGPFAALGSGRVSFAVSHQFQLSIDELAS